jgi:hypothetical protein
MKMMNNYLICEVQEEAAYEGFTVQNSDAFVKTKVLHSSEEDIPVGCTVRISAAAGMMDENGLTIRRTDVINIV